MKTSRRLTLRGAALAPSLLVAAATLACETPTMVDVPDGATATTEEMVRAREQVTEYVAAMEEYLACVNEEIEVAGENATEEFKALMIQRYNAAVGEMETVAAAFDEQLRAYRAANPQ
ncbi:MAG TPA: hypothetical protein VF339_11835 [Gammaproteobacteria bacterium]